MKRRASFVSNSSSSSFLVVPEGKDSFADSLGAEFREPEEILSCDLQSAKAGAEPVRAFFGGRLYAESYDYFISLVEEFSGGSINRRNALFLPSVMRTGREKFMKAAEMLSEFSGGRLECSKVVSAVDNLRNSMRGRFLEEQESNPKFLEDDGVYRSVYEFCKNRTVEMLDNPAMEAFAENVVRAFPLARVVDYADDTDEGATMRFEFMPMLASKNGSAKWLVFENSHG